MKKIIIIFTSIILIILLWNLSRSKDYQIFGKIINRINTSEKIVALTFDDGPTIKHTDQIIEILNSTNIKATFFLVGKYIEENPQEFKKIVDHGHEIGNHSYSHKLMIIKSYKSIAKEIKKTNNLIKQLGYRGETYFRPPYGKKLFILPYYLDKNNITTITYDVAPDSYLDVSASPTQISDYVVNNTNPGSIILLHIMFKSYISSMKAVPDIINRLRVRGYRFVTITELIEHSEHQQSSL
ncbi:MAG: polysaccharide deacetylase family protein [Spirochaetota bacterium]|nr:polysaccharide deacetylase family protein [Spirochaetota bacterium]